VSNCVSCSPQIFERLGYRSIILQIGRGVYEPEIIDRKGFSMKYYRYKDSIEGDIQGASLVISHAGKANLLEGILQFYLFTPNKKKHVFRPDFYNKESGRAVFFVIYYFLLHAFFIYYYLPPGALRSNISKTKHQILIKHKFV